MKLQFTPYVFVPYDADNEVFTDWYRFPALIPAGDIYHMLQEEMEEFVRENNYLHRNFQQMKADLQEYHQRNISQLHKKMAEEGRI